MNLSNIDSYAGIQEEIERNLTDTTEEQLQKINNLSFMLLGPDTLTEDRLNSTFKILRDKGIKVIDYKFYPKITEKLIEELYKYSVPDAVKTMPHFLNNDCNIKGNCPYMSFIPTRNWRILRKKYLLGTSVALILHSESDDTARVVKKLKGPTDPLLCTNKQIRNKTDNPAFSMAHSSDDASSVARETMLFFGADRFRSVIQSKEIHEISFNKLKEEIEIIKPSINEFRFPVVFLKTRLRILISDGDLQKDKLYKFYINWLNEFKTVEEGKKSLFLLTTFLDAEKEILIQLKINCNLLSVLNNRENFKDIDFDELMLNLKLKNVYLNEYETLILESGLWYYRDLYKNETEEY